MGRQQRRDIILRNVVWRGICLQASGATKRLEDIIMDCPGTSGPRMIKEAARLARHWLVSRKRRLAPSAKRGGGKARAVTRRPFSIMPRQGSRKRSAFSQASFLALARNTAEVAMWGYGPGSDWRGLS